MIKPIINLEEVELQPRPASFAPTGETAERFDAKMAMIAPQIGAQLLGYNITCVPPGKRAFPFHNHRVNEEMFLILEGSGETRIGETTYLGLPSKLIHLSRRQSISPSCVVRQLNSELFAFLSPCWSSTLTPINVN